VAKSFAWLTGPGIYHGSLVFGSQNPGDSVMADTQLLPYPYDESRQRRLASPLSLVLSEFHFLLLYEDRFIAVSQLDNTIAHEESLGRGSRGSRMRGLVFDPTKSALWAYAEDAIYQVFVMDEDRHVWRKYLEKGLFEEALRYCKLPHHRDQVLLGQAEYYLQSKRFESAARAFAKTTAPFEEIALRFIALGEKDALKAFLTTKLSYMPPPPGIHVLCLRSRTSTHAYTHTRARKVPATIRVDAAYSSWSLDRRAIPRPPQPAARGAPAGSADHAPR
jgi:hypothetical protein